MSRKKTALVIICYLFVAMAYGFWSRLSEPTPSPYVIAEAVRRGFGVFALSGIIAVVIWACTGFRSQKAHGLLVLGPLVAIVLAPLAEFAHWQDRQAQLAEMAKEEAKGPTLTAGARTDFIRNFNNGCVVSQRQQAIDHGDSDLITDQQIAKYCDCSANRLAEIATIEEWRQAMSDGRMPPSLQTKVNQAASSCRAAVFQ